jgi:hypothetical protein
MEVSGGDDPDLPPDGCEDHRGRSIHPAIRHLAHRNASAISLCPRYGRSDYPPVVAVSEGERSSRIPG